MFLNRQFAGIAAFVERVFASEFTARFSGDHSTSGLVFNKISHINRNKNIFKNIFKIQKYSPEGRAEIEVADFDRLFTKLEKVEVK